MTSLASLPIVSPDRDLAVPPRAPGPLPWPFLGWSMPVWWLAWGFGWWRASLHQLDHLAALERTFARVAPAAALIAVLARLGGVLCETAFYAALWRTRGARLPFWRYAAHVMLGSFLDLQALELVAGRAAAAPLSRWRVALVGPAALPHATVLSHPVLATGFATLGLVSLTRLAWMAWAQATATGRPLARTAALVAALWLVTHLALALLVSLAQGRSVLR